MKYKLIIDKEAEEEINVIVHAPSSLTKEIEDVLRRFSGADFIMGYRDEEIRKLSFGEIECITILDRKTLDGLSDDEFLIRPFSWRGRNIIQRNVDIYERSKK